MIQSARIRGVLAPVVTPFRADLVPRKSLAHAAERGNRHEYERE